MEGQDLLDFDYDEIMKKSKQKQAAAEATAPVPAPEAPSEEDKEVSDKSRVTVIFEGQEHIVSWYEGTPSSDVMEAILCACDCILESGFELIDSDGKAVDFHAPNPIKSGETYHLYKGEEMKEFKKVLGDKWRKVKITVEALRHAEAQRAVEIMQMGSNLLKYTNKGVPHIRQFQLSSDMQRIIWYSGSKPQSETTIELKNVENVWVGGQNIEMVKKTLPMLSNISFTIVYKHNGEQRKIHLTSKDEQEFDLWVCGIKALSYHFKGVPISKLDLLSHSRQFNYHIENKQIGESTKLFFNPPKEGSPKKSLEDYIIRKLRSKEELFAINHKLADRLISLRDEVDEATESLNVEPENAEVGYRVLSAKESEADDVTQLKNRMNELLEACTKENAQVLQELEALVEEPGKSLEFEKKLKNLDARMWKIEIDIENISDMVKRIKLQNDVTWKEKFKNWFPKIF